MKKKYKRKIRELCLNVLISIFTFIFIILLFECLARTYDFISDPEEEILHFYDKVVLSSSDSGYPVWVKYKDTLDGNFIDSRENIFPVKKPDNVFRMIGLGDSITYGIGADSDETYIIKLGNLLEQNFKTKKLKVEAINLGMGAYSIIQEADVLENYGLKLEPDLIILQLFQNDFTTYKFVNRTNYAVKKDLIVEEFNNKIIPYSIPIPHKLNSGLISISSLYRKLSVSVQNIKDKTDLENYEIGEEENIDDNLKALGNIVLLCKENSIPLFIVLFPETNVEFSHELISNLGFRAVLAVSH